MRLYKYVGPDEIRAKSVGRAAGALIQSSGDVAAWIEASGQEMASGGLFAATFVIDAQGRLLVADRCSEHVACAGGGEVRAAGEIFFEVGNGAKLVVIEVTNQSTGYCPEPSCWGAVEAALDRIGLKHPGRFTTECVFRLCEKCGARNVVKEGWFYCDICGAALAEAWNFE